MQLARSISEGGDYSIVAGLPIGRRQASVFETLLTKTQRPPASQGFGLTQEFSIFRPSKMQRCTSAPLALGSLFTDEEPAAASVCRGCNSPTATHSTDRHGCVSCDSCGAVVQERKLVALGHDKATRSDQDSTTRAETWRTDEPDPADLETATEAFARHATAIGGTPLFSKKSKLGVSTAVSAIRRTAVSEYRATIGWSSKLETRHRAVLIIMTEILDGSETVHDRVAEVCRRALRSILERSEKHANVCRAKDCSVLIDQVPNALLASMAIRVAVERLESKLGTSEWPLQGVEVTRASLLKLVDQAGFSSGRAGPLQVATARVAVERLLDQTTSIPPNCDKLFPIEQDESSSVPAVESALPPTLESISPPDPTPITPTPSTLPLPILGVEKNLSTESLVDAVSNNSIFAIRNALWALSQVAKASAIREKAFELLAVGPAADWARSVEMGADEAACCLSLAIAQKTGRDTSSLDATLRLVAKQNASSVSVARSQVEKLMLILPESLSIANDTDVTNTVTDEHSTVDEDLL